MHRHCGIFIWIFIIRTRTVSNRKTRFKYNTHRWYFWNAYGSRWNLIITSTIRYFGYSYFRCTDQETRGLQPGYISYFESLIVKKKNNNKTKCSSAEWATGSTNIKIFHARISRNKITGNGWTTDTCTGRDVGR